MVKSQQSKVWAPTDLQQIFKSGRLGRPFGEMEIRFAEFRASFVQKFWTFRVELCKMIGRTVNFY